VPRQLCCGVRRRSFDLDEETALILKKWLGLSPVATNVLVKKYATEVGLHKPGSKRLDDRLTSHCGRHYFTTQMFEAGMPREQI
jgi:integrase